jgi:hypothetical protein
MTTPATIPDDDLEAAVEAAVEAAASALYAHHDPDAADAVAQRAVDVVASTAALRSAAAGRGHAAAIPSTLAHLEAATQNLAAAVDELRMETLWHLRDTEPATATDDDHVAACARDFSAFAGRLYAAREAAGALRERVERQPWRLRPAHQVASIPAGRDMHAPPH